MSQGLLAIEPPPATWWRQRSLIAIEAGALVVLGIGVAVNYLPGSRYWIGVFVGGLVALAITLAIGGLYTIHDGWEQHRHFYTIWEQLEQKERSETRAIQAMAEDAFGLGYSVSTIPSDLAEIHEQCLFLRSFCRELGLPLSPGTYERLVRSIPRDGDEMATLAAEIREVVERVAPREWRCFFHLGATIEWLIQEAERKRPLRRVERELQMIQADEILSRHLRYAAAVEELLAVIGSVRYDGYQPVEGQGIPSKVHAVLVKLPDIDVGTLSTPFPTPITEWYWVGTETGAPAAMCFVGDQSVFTTVAVADGSIEGAVAGYYEVSTGDEPDKARITPGADGWHCSVDEGVTFAHPCDHLDLVLTVSDGGLPVTEARTILVRSGHDDTGENDS